MGPHEGQSYLSFDNVANSARYVLDGLASGIASLLGLIPERVRQRAVASTGDDRSCSLH